MSITWMTLVLVSMLLFALVDWRSFRHAGKATRYACFLLYGLAAVIWCIETWYPDSLALAIWLRDVFAPLNIYERR